MLTSSISIRLGVLDEQGHLHYVREHRVPEKFKEGTAAFYLPILQTFYLVFQQTRPMNNVASFEITTAYTESPEIDINGRAEHTLTIANIPFQIIALPSTVDGGPRRPFVAFDAEKTTVQIVAKTKEGTKMALPSVTFHHIRDIHLPRFLPGHDPAKLDLMEEEVNPDELQRLVDSTFTIEELGKRASTPCKVKGEGHVHERELASSIEDDGDEDIEITQVIMSPSSKRVIPVTNNPFQTPSSSPLKRERADSPLISSWRSDEKPFASPKKFCPNDVELVIEGIKSPTPAPSSEPMIRDEFSSGQSSVVEGAGRLLTPPSSQPSASTASSSSPADQKPARAVRTDTRVAAHRLRQDCTIRIRAIEAQLAQIDAAVARTPERKRQIFMKLDVDMERYRLKKEKEAKKNAEEVDQEEAAWRDQRASLVAEKGMKEMVSWRAPARGWKIANIKPMCTVA